MQIDLNCDMGEGIGNDEALMRYITSANIAYGYHAGDEETMRTTILLAKKHGVHAGAHPSFPDKENFGRTAMKLSPQEVYAIVRQQLQLFQTVADETNSVFRHVKPHGALYNSSAKDAATAKAIANAVTDFNPQLILFGLSGSLSIAEAKAVGLRTMSEVFADRTYQDDGSLTPRSQAGALIENEEKAVRQVLQMMRKKTVTTVSGKEIPIDAETVCVHGDGRNAIVLAKRLYDVLQ